MKSNNIISEHKSKCRRIVCCRSVFTPQYNIRFIPPQPHPISRFTSINDTLVNMFDRFIHRWLRIPYVLNLHYFSHPSRPKATILLIHGLGTSWQTWKPLEPYLPKDTRVIAIDMLGFGNSPKLPASLLLYAKRQLLASTLSSAIPWARWLQWSWPNSIRI